MHVDVAHKSGGDGKLVRACVAFEGDRAANVTFTGDFFLEPADLLDALSHAVSGTTRGEIAARVTAFFEANPDRLLIGAAPADFVAVVERAFDRRDATAP